MNLVSLVIQRLHLRPPPIPQGFCGGLPEDFIGVEFRGDCFLRRQ